MRYAVYSCLYGEDFIQESILSLIDHVDRVFVFLADKPWGGSSGCMYKGKYIEYPAKFDSIVEKIEELDDSRITLINRYVDSSTNRFTRIINEFVLPDYDKPDMIICIDPDMVFHEHQIVSSIDTFLHSGIDTAQTTEIELWRTPEYRIPLRVRCGAVFWNLSNLDCLPKTSSNGNLATTPWMMNNYVHNFGFAMTEKNMLMKHLTTLSYAKLIAEESLPHEDWYDNKWLSWDIESNNSNLEISIGYESDIPYALPYDVKELPSLIKDKYGYDR